MSNVSKPLHLRSHITIVLPSRISSVYLTAVMICTHSCRGVNSPVQPPRVYSQLSKNFPTTTPQGSAPAPLVITPRPSDLQYLRTSSVTLRRTRPFVCFSLFLADKEHQACRSATCHLTSRQPASQTTRSKLSLTVLIFRRSKIK